VAVLGSNGSGKSHFLRLLAGQPVDHAGTWKLGARVVPGYFAQTHAHPELEGKTLVGVLWDSYARNRGAAMSALRRYELDRQGDQLFDRLSGGQQARFQILLLELEGSTALLLDEPTDNLDLESAEALQEGLEAYEGTVLAVTHDRWFARTFDRFLVFGADGVVRESAGARRDRPLAAPIRGVGVRGEQQRHVEVTRGGVVQGDGAERDDDLRVERRHPAVSEIQAGGKRQPVHPAGGLGREPDPAVRVGDACLGQ
jgi:ABC-type multidrug transport system ATPase subunit